MADFHTISPVLKELDLHPFQIFKILYGDVSTGDVRFKLRLKMADLQLFFLMG